MTKTTVGVEATHPPSLAGDLRVLIGRLRRRLRDESRPGAYSWSQISILGRLDRDGPATVSSLAREEGMRPQSMGAIVATLQAEGLISSAPHPTDGRQTLLTVTDACRDLVRSNRAAREDWLSHAIQSKLSIDEQHTLARGIELLKRLVDS